MLKNLDEENSIDNKTNHNNITTSKIKLLNTITQ